MGHCDNASGHSMLLFFLTCKSDGNSTRCINGQVRPQFILRNDKLARYKYRDVTKEVKAASHGVDSMSEGGKEARLDKAEVGGAPTSTKKRGRRNTKGGIGIMAEANNRKKSQANDSSSSRHWNGWTL